MNAYCLMQKYKNIILDVCDDLSHKEIKSGLRKKSRSKSANEVFVKAVTWLVTDALAAKVSSEKGYITVSRNASLYTKQKPDRTGLAPLGLSYETAIRDPKTEAGALDSLWLFGYLRKVGGGNYACNTPEGKSSVTKYEATPKLMEGFEGNLIETLFLPKPKRETIILKGPSEDPAIQGEVAYRFYKDTEQTHVMRENLDRINENILRHWYDLYIANDTYQLLLQEIAQRQKRSKTFAEKEKYTSINLSNRTLRRVFGRGSFEMGGRFYGGWWQNIPSAYRSVITINGYRTIEADYSQFHPNILYHLRQSKLEELDAYTRILGVEHRDLSKQIFNACLNASYEMTRPPRGMKISHTGLKWLEIVQRLRNAHPLVADAFFKDEGMKLQFYDSQMAELVMLAFAKDKKPIMPVHDSFLVLEDDQELLLERMEAAYQHVLGKDIKIDIKKTKFQILPPPDTPDIDEVLSYSDWLNRNDAADEYQGRMI